MYNFQLLSLHRISGGPASVLCGTVGSLVSYKLSQSKAQQGGSARVRVPWVGYMVKGLGSTS
jgi:hypothetical protein